VLEAVSPGHLRPYTRKGNALFRALPLTLTERYITPSSCSNAAIGGLLGWLGGQLLPGGPRQRVGAQLGRHSFPILFHDEYATWT
jgi:hypothetical protein